MPWIKKCNKCGAELGEIEPEAMEKMIRKVGASMLLDPRNRVATLTSWCATCDPRAEQAELTSTFMMKKGDA